MIRDRTIENARIAGTTLGWEDHGIFTAMLHLEFEGTSQGFGGYGLDEWIEAEEVRMGTAGGLQFIMDVCRVVGVDSWEKLPGKHVRADRSWEKIHRIGHITKNLWFDPAEMFERLRPAHERAK